MKMKKMGKRLTAIAAALLISASIAVPVSAASIPTYVGSGNCGQNAEWTLDTNGNLKITGTGRIDREYNNSWRDYKDQIRTVTIGEGLINVEGYSFDGCTNLTTVKLPSTMIEIESGSFRDCKKLTTINFPKNLKSIWQYAFQRCTSLEKITLPEGLEEIVGGGGSYVFAESGLREVTLPSTVASWGSTFANCDQLEKVTVKNKNIGAHEFEGCDNLKEVVIGDTTETIREWAFANCPSLEKIDFGKNVQRIACGAFENCDGLESVVLPDSATTYDRAGWAGDGAFLDCDGLKTVTVGVNTELLTRTFRNCDNLETVYFTGDAPTFEGKIFEGCGDLTVYIPESAYGKTWTASYFNSQGARSVDWNTWDVPVSHFAVKAGSAKNSSEKVSVSWKGMDGADHYEIFRKKGTEKDYKKIATTTKTSYSDTTAKENGMKYTYKIRAIGPNGEKSYNSSAMVTYYVTRPTVSKVSQRGGGKLTAYYGKIGSANGYQVQFSASSKFTSPSTVTIRSGKTTSASKTLKKGKKYYIRARAFNTVSGKNYFSNWKNYSKTVVAK